MRLQQSSSPIESAGKGTNGYSSSDSNSGSSNSSSSEDNYQYHSKKRRLIQGYAASSKSEVSDGGSSISSLVHAISSSSSGGGSPASVGSSGSSGLEGFSSLVHPISPKVLSESSNNNAAVISSLPPTLIMTSTSTTGGGNGKPLALVQKHGDLKNENGGYGGSGYGGASILKKEYFMNGVGTQQQTTVNMAVNIIKGEKHHKSSKAGTGGALQPHHNNCSDDVVPLSASTGPLNFSSFGGKSSSSSSGHSQLGMNYPFNLLVEAAVQMREYELRHQQAAPQ